MQFYPKLNEENIKRLCNKYMLEKVESGDFEIKNQTVYINLNYHTEREFYPVGKIFGVLSPSNIEGFKQFFKRLVERNV